jgi:energy-coupling factor transporter transmembrane protein EcfT
VLRSVAPAARLLFGLGLLAACVAAPARTGAGLLLAAGLAAAALAVTGTGGRRALRLLAVGATLHAPLPLLVLAAAPDPFSGPLANAAAISLKGMAALVISLAVASTMRAAELHVALRAVPLPRTTKLLLLQIGHQCGTLLHEAGRLRQALAVRGASRGLLPGVRAAAGLPQVWLARLSCRSVRVAAAMEVRGYGLHALDAPVAGAARLRRGDMACTAAGAAALAAALLLHAA